MCIGKAIDSDEKDSFELQTFDVLNIEDAYIALLPNHLSIWPCDIYIDQTPSSYIVQLGPAVRGGEDVVLGGEARYVTRLAIPFRRPT